MHTPNKAAVLIGFGMGGFSDFMILHLVFQWHHRISNRVPPDTLEALQRNIYWDGVGQTAMWLLTLIGVLWHGIARCVEAAPVPPNVVILDVIERV